MLKANKVNLKKLESLYKEAGYRVRYGKGNFQAGYCINSQQKQIIVNKFYPLESKFSLLVDIIKEIQIDMDELSKDYQKVYDSLLQKADSTQDQN